MTNQDNAILEDEVEESVEISKKRHFLESFLFSVISIVLTFPVFIIVYRYIPDLVINIFGGIRVDHILTFLVIFGTIRIIMGLFRYWMIGLLVLVTIYLSINQIRGKYGFSEAYSDYTDLISYVTSNPISIPYLKDSKMTVRNASKIKEAIDYQNPEVREFAVKSSLKYFRSKNLYNKYGNLVRYFSLFKVINRWEYVPDPKNEDYFAKASESVKLMAGDCDDYAILMAACMKAIGGEVRIVHTDKHLYPEVKVGKEEDIAMLVRVIKRELFYKESLGEQIYYHLDSEHNVWLNFDYTGKYPGAKFMNDKVLGILDI